jgi:hypothetical protein
MLKIFAGLVRIAAGGRNKPADSAAIESKVKTIFTFHNPLCCAGGICLLFTGS